MGFVADYMMKRGGLDALQGQKTGDPPKQQTGSTGKLGLK